jgi:hypothetical protein
MPNAPPTNGRNSFRGSRMSSNTKDPPWSRRALDAAYTVKAALQEQRQLVEASFHWIDASLQWIQEGVMQYWLESQHDNCRQIQTACQASLSPDATGLSTPAQTRRLTCIEATPEDKPKLSCLPPPLSPRANALSFESNWPKAAYSVPTTQKGLGIGPSSMDDEQAYRDTLSHLRMNHTVSQELHALSPTTTTVSEQMKGEPGEGSMRASPGIDETQVPSQVPMKSDTIPSELNVSCRTRETSPSSHNKADKSTATCSPLRQEPRCFVSEATTAPHSPSFAAMDPNKEELPPASVELAGAGLHPNLRSSRRMTDASPPVGEGSPSMTGQLRAGKTTSKGEETSTCEYAPIAKVALMLPNQSLASSMRAAPSCPRNDEARSPSMKVSKQKQLSHPSKDKFKPSFSMAAERRKPEVDVNPNLHPSHAVLHSRGEIHPSQPPKEADTMTR